MDQLVVEVDGDVVVGDEVVLLGGQGDESISVEEVAANRRRAIPAQRFGTAEEFGQVCAFICSMQASYLTGQNILLDGGAYPGTF